MFHYLKSPALNLFLLSIVAVTSSSCIKVVRQGEAGVVQRMGKMKKKHLSAGTKLYNPFTTRILKIPTRTENLLVTLDLPSKEGMSIYTETSVLYHVQPDSAPHIYSTYGRGYESGVILPVFRSACADVSSRFYAKDLHSGNGRPAIEKSVKERMNEVLGVHGLVVENVLLKSIKLPPGLAQAIEAKLQSEQAVQQMEFILQREKLEADRKKIEAEGIRESQLIITQGLSPLVIQYNSIEAFKELSKSPNTKIILTDGKAPFLINQ